MFLKLVVKKNYKTTIKKTRVKKNSKKEAEPYGLKLISYRIIKTN